MRRDIEREEMKEKGETKGCGGGKGLLLYKRGREREGETYMTIRTHTNDEKMEARKRLYPSPPKKEYTRRETTRTGWAMA